MNRAELEALLEGVALPASRDELVEYAAEQDAGNEPVAALHGLPEREYRSLDEVGEALSPVQPQRTEQPAAPPRAESGDPPGHERYTAS